MESSQGGYDINDLYDQSPPLCRFHRLCRYLGEDMGRYLKRAREAIERLEADRIVALRPGAEVWWQKFPGQVEQGPAVIELTHRTEDGRIFIFVEHGRDWHWLNEILITRAGTWRRDSARTVQSG